MKAQSLFIPVILILSLFFINCKEKESIVPKQIEFSETEYRVLQAGNSFAFRFFKNINKNEAENTLVSPFSVSLALTMTSNGACNFTDSAIKEVLFLTGMEEERINESYRDILNKLLKADREVVLEIANAIWFRNTFQVEEGFKSVNQQYYHAKVEGLDFTSPAAVETINNWVGEVTHQKIEKIVNSISPEDVMFLVNALYFKGNWKYAFDESETGIDKFYTQDDVFEVKMMEQTVNLNYYTDSFVEVVELPYGDEHFSMMIFLPGEDNSLNDVINRFDQERWTEWNEGITKRRINIKFPKFEFMSEFELNKMLSEMGMKVAFEPGKADFCRMNPNSELFISKVKHKTYIDLDEKGTEAAAVTSVGISLTSVGGEQGYPFHVNRPFVFAIKENTTNSIMFLGKVMKPE